MRSLRDGGTTVLIVTHRIAELIRISDRATVLRDGRDVGVLEKHEITEKNLLQLMTGIDRENNTHFLTAPQPKNETKSLKVRGLSVWPGAEPFDFDLRRGEIVGVAGLDGQGQDAFVRILGGVQSASQGSVQVMSRDNSWSFVRNLNAAVAAKIAYVSGDRKREGIFASLSIFENMVISLYRDKKRAGVLGIIDSLTLGGIFKREADNLLIKFGFKEDKITSLSGGNQQKVLIGRGFAMKPDVIVLNDPARGIDVGAKSELYKHLNSFAEEGKSVVYMSSELEEFIGFATRVIVFRNGAPFDAFDGRSLEPKVILEAMFGQTSGLGLAASFGLLPNKAISQKSDNYKSDGVRVLVEVPQKIKSALQEKTALLKQPVVRKEQHVVVASKKLTSPIRIVEFDAYGEKSRDMST